MTAYYDKIDGHRIVAGKVIRVYETGLRVRFHARRCFGELYWTCDRQGKFWSRSLPDAHANTPEGRRDVLPEKEVS